MLSIVIDCNSIYNVPVYTVLQAVSENNCGSKESTKHAIETRLEQTDEKRQHIDLVAFSLVVFPFV